MCVAKPIDNCRCEYLCLPERLDIFANHFLRGNAEDELAGLVGTGDDSVGADGIECISAEIAHLKGGEQRRIKMGLVDGLCMLLWLWRGKLGEVHRAPFSDGKISMGAGARAHRERPTSPDT